MEKIILVRTGENTEWSKTMEDAFFQIYLEDLEMIVPCGKEEESARLEELQLGGLLAQTAKNRLIESNLSRVIEWVKEYADRGLPTGDLIQEGNIALMTAVSSYREGEFGSYLEAEVRKALETAIEAETMEAQTEEEIVARVNVLKDVAEMMAEELGREATAEELAKRMKMTADEIRAIIKMTLDAMSTGEEQEILE